MNGEQKDNIKPEKNKAAITGFILSVLLFLTSLTGIYGVVLFFTIAIYKNSILLFFLICFLIALPGIIFSILGIRQKKQKIFAWFGLSLSFFCAFVVLPIRHITFTPAGSLPYTLEIYKFRKACPRSSFWLDYDKNNIVDIRCMDTGLFINFGAIHFKNSPGKYHDEDVIKYAEQNGWKFHFTVPFTSKDFIKYKNKSFDVNDELMPYALGELKNYCEVPFIIENDCNVHAFATADRYVVASFIVVAKDGSDIVIRYAAPIIPEGPSERLNTALYLEELSEKRKKTSSD